MKKAIRLYDQLLLPWLVVVVYLWLLQLIAVFGMHDPEPLFDQAADHVPLIIRYPNQDRGTKSTKPVQSINIAPTILSAIGIPVPKWMDGEAVTADRSPEVADMLITNYKEPDERRIYEQPTELAIKQGHYKLLVSCEMG